jgi:uncharacterized membrane protein YesL
MQHFMQFIEVNGHYTLFGLLGGAVLIIFAAIQLYETIRAKFQKPQS